MAVTRRPLPIAQMEQLQRRVIVTAAGAHTEAGLNPVQDQRWPVVEHHRTHAMQQWHQLGRPGRDRLGITALGRELGQYVRLDDPDGPYAWPLTR